MTATPQQIAFHAGKERGLADAPAAENPHTGMSRERRTLSAAWLDGWQQGRAQRALSLAEGQL